MARRKVVIAAGGTGGHLFPAQQLAEMLKGDSDLLILGHKITTSPFFERENIPFAEISAHPLKKGFLKASWRGFWQAVRQLRAFSPDVVVGFGSFHVFPVLLAAAILRKKIVLFEANCSLGKVNRLFLPFAKRIGFQFPVAVRKGVLVPLLPWKEGRKKMDPALAKQYYGLGSEQKTILVFGGSQGASFLNESAPQAIGRLKVKFQVIHFTGSKDLEAVRSAYEKLAVVAAVKAFEKEMAYAYSAADLALCRSGASTVAELIQNELPALLIPYPHASDDHQRKNGVYLASGLKAARLISQAEASIERLIDELELLALEREERKKALANFDNQTRVHLAQIIRWLT
jgi:UDP-N-acetylglucosamine--N-acetylmuramyl-(pentapeptide) pyrophosphoryl-undecaprenol N-acetylglucosamine transferase